MRKLFSGLQDRESKQTEQLVMSDWGGRCWAHLHRRLSTSSVLLFSSLLMRIRACCLEFRCVMIAQKVLRKTKPSFLIFSLPGLLLLTQNSTVSSVVWHGYWKRRMQKGENFQGTIGNDGTMICFAGSWR